MQKSKQATELAQQGKVREAFSVLSSAAERGDGAAAYQLAEWRLAGNLVRRDLGEARRLFERAYHAGLTKAVGPYIALLASGAGNTGRYWREALELLIVLRDRDPAAAIQCELLKQMNIDANGDPIQVIDSQCISPAPHICKLPGFLSLDECRYLVELALPLLQPSVVVHPQTGVLIQDPVRTSMAAAFPFINENPVLQAINRRIAAATHTDYNQGEPLQILGYSPGQEYKPHSDALPHGVNQRVKTLLVYLNADYEGGETCFIHTGLRFRGAPGDAIVFDNVDLQGRADPAALHAGLPVDKGRKMMLSKWIRAQPLDLAGPSGRPF